MPLVRTNATKRKTVLKLDESDSSGPDETESDFTKEDYTNFIFNDNEKQEMLREMRNSIAYVYIRAHSNLPYDSSKPYKFDTYEMPDDMNLTKISAAPNGEVNTSFYDYQDKKDHILSAIKAYNTEVKKGEEEKDDTFTAAAYIAGFLKRLEKKTKIIKNYKERNEISKNKMVLNKIIQPLSEKEQAERENYIAVQIMFLDKNDEFQSFDVYPFVYKIYRKYEGKIITGHNNAIKIDDIIKFLYDYLLLKNVVLIDFSCASSNVNKDLIDDLNDNNLHGGIKKTKKYKRKYKKNKKTKKYKRKSKKI
jgi:hypothetical protein